MSSTDTTIRPHGSSPAYVRRRNPLAKAVRNLGIMIDTAARVVLLGRDGV
ncbi:hypothetical protein [Kitasatospora sp. NPDC059571]